MDTEGQAVRGQLRVYLGTAPGSGTTYAMVEEGHRLARSPDTVVAVCDFAACPATAHLLTGLEIVPRSPSAQTGGVDISAVRARAPQIALVDRLADPGRQHAVEQLLDAGIDVITTVDITEIESLRDAVEAITDLPPPVHTVPDRLVEDAAATHLVDIDPAESSHGTVSESPAPPPARWVTDPVALSALRHLTLVWLADRLGARPPIDHEQYVVADARPGRPIATDNPPMTSAHRTAAGPSGWRLRTGWLMAVLGPPALSALLLAPTVHLDLPLNVQLFLALVVLVALIGGIWPAIVTATVSSASLNWFFTPPRRTWIIHDPQDVAAIGLFVLVAVAVASVVHRNVQRTSQALDAQREAAHYGDLATSLLASPAQLDLLLARALTTFGSRRAAVIRYDDGQPAYVLASAEAPPAESTDDPLISKESVDDRHELVLEGVALPASGRRLLTAYAATVSAILTRLALQESTSTARALARDNVARTALLSAVSHDLRTPLASIKAAASGLLDPLVTFTEADRHELLRTIDDSSDELDTLISDLLDVSRLHEGALASNPRTFVLAEALPSSKWPDRVQISPALSSITVLADRGLLERVIANIVDNALAYAGSTSIVELLAVSGDGRVRLLVRDDGPGVAPAERSAMFLPFQRRDDAHSGHVGLGLAIARGLVEAMSGSVTAAETPGGGLTMVIDLPAGRPVLAPERTL